jgi:hypothetical protein
MFQWTIDPVKSMIEVGEVIFYQLFDKEKSDLRKKTLFLSSISFKVATMTWLTSMEYLYHK